MSLVSVLISFGLLSTAVLSTAHMMKSSISSQRHISAKSELGDFVQRVRFFLNNLNACQAYFQGGTFDTTSTKLPSQEITGVIIFSPGNPQNVIAETGTNIGSGLKLSKLFLHNFVKNRTDTYVADLGMRFEYASGLKTMKNIPIEFQTAVTNPPISQITDCLSISSGTPDNGSFPQQMQYKSIYTNYTHMVIDYTVPAGKIFTLINLTAPGLCTINDITYYNGSMGFVEGETLQFKGAAGGGGCRFSGVLTDTPFPDIPTGKWWGITTYSFGRQTSYTIPANHRLVIRSYRKFDINAPVPLNPFGGQVGGLPGGNQHLRLGRISCKINGFFSNDFFQFDESRFFQQAGTTLNFTSAHCHFQGVLIPI